VTNQWALRDDGPQLVPPGDVVFQCLYPKGLQLPTAASAVLEYGDGAGTEFDIDEGLGGFNNTSNRTYEKKGTYFVKIRIFNLASEFTIVNRVRCRFTAIPNFSSKIKTAEKTKQET
jgi:hypothetical protein